MRRPCSFAPGAAVSAWETGGMGKVVGVVAMAVVVLAGGAWLLGRRGGELPAARWQLAEALREEGGEGFARADGPRDFAFPADHGPHPDFRLEWWYFTGNLEGADGRRFGYQLTFFRRALAPPDDEEAAPAAEEGERVVAPGPGGEGADGGGERAGGETAAGGEATLPGEEAITESAWRTRQVYLAHFAVTDAAERRFHAFEELARGAAGLAGAKAEPFAVWVGGWRATSAAGEPSTGAGGAAAGRRAAGGGAPGRGAAELSSPPPSDPAAGRRAADFRAPPSDPAADRAAGGVFPLRLAAAAEGVAIDLLLATAKPPVLQGDRGLSVKGPGAGNASYYYSLTRLPTRGTVTLDGERFAVTGLSWLDREWSTTLLGPGERGWDWLALQLDDGRELTGWRIRRPGSPPDRLDSLTLIEPDGTPRRLDPARHRLLASSPWTSPAGTRYRSARYPTAWRLTGPDLDLALAALLPDQELTLSFRYWEGAVTARGTVGGTAVAGRGYVEMTGYDEAGRSAPASGSD